MRRVEASDHYQGGSWYPCSCGKCPPMVDDYRQEAPASDGPATEAGPMEQVLMTHEEHRWGCVICGVPIEAEAASLAAPDGARSEDGERERELRKRLTRHHRDEHVTAGTCRSCLAVLAPRSEDGG